MSEGPTERQPLLRDGEEGERRASEGPARPRRLSSASIPPYDGYISNQSHSTTSIVAIWTVVPVLLIGVFVTNGDTSLVVASSSKIAGEFRALKDASWLVTSYAMAQCAIQPLYGKLSDIVGRKSNLAAAYILFTIGCLVSGVGKTYWQVIAGRALSGLGSAGMTALVSIVITDMVPVRQIAAWRSYVNIAATMGRSLGGPVGGYLTDTIGWRASFTFQVPITLIGLLLVLWRVPNHPRDVNNQGGDCAEPQTRLSEKVKRVDFLGAVSLACCISGFLLVLDLLARDAASWHIFVATIATIAGGLAFYHIEAHFAKEPVLPLQLLTRRVPLTAYSLISFQIAAQFAVYYVVPIYFQIGAGETVSAAGLRLVPAVVGNAVGSILTGLVVSRGGRYRLISIMASAAATVGYMLMLIRWRGTTSWPELSYFLLGGFGMGVIQSTTYVHLAAHLEPSDMAIAGTTLYMVQGLWTLVGLQVTIVTLKASLRSSLDHDLSGVPDKLKTIEQSLQSIDLIRSLPSAVRQLVTAAYISSIRTTFALSVVFSSLALLVTLLIQEKRL